MKLKEPCLILENRETEKEAKEEITSEDTTNSESEAIPILNQSKIEAKETEEISEIEAKMFVKDEKDLKEVNIKETKNEIVDKTDKIDVKVDKKDKSYTEEECLNALNETKGDSFIDATSSSSPLSTSLPETAALLISLSVNTMPETDKKTVDVIADNLFEVSVALDQASTVAKFLPDTDHGLAISSSCRVN